MQVIIGFHVPATGGYTAMVECALAARANTFQFFTRNPRGGAARALDEADILAANRKMFEAGIEQIVAHAPYTLNPCAVDPRAAEFARQAFRDDLRRLKHLPSAMYNLHPGCHVGEGVEAGLKTLVSFLDECIPRDCVIPVLLETMAGKGTELGGNFAQLRWVIDHVQSSKCLGVCLDTCHVFDAGYDVCALDALLDEFDRVIGLDRLKTVHVNDSQNLCGSHKDRHARLGEGEIGWGLFTDLVCEKRLCGIPLILEKPTDLKFRADEIARLREAIIPDAKTACGNRPVSRC